MTIECTVALTAAEQAHSPLLLTFGSDSLVEFISAAIVLAQFIKFARMSEATATRLAAVLLYLLAAVVLLISLLSLRSATQPEESLLGVAVTAAALLMMPILSWLKRREAKRLNDKAMAADAVQSATCAYLAALSLIGVGLNAKLHLGWIDSVAALFAVPILLYEARQAWKGHKCC